MDENVISFSGSNEKLFTRYVVKEINPKLTLIVPETHTAILIKDGQMLQTLTSGKYLVSKFLDEKTDVNSFVEILFMSKTAKLKLLWGTSSKILMYDSTLQENYRVGLSGDFEVQIGDPRKCYLYLVGTSESLTADALQERLMSNVVSVLESVLVEYVEKNRVPFNQISVNKREISKLVLSKLSQKLMSEYGIAVFSFNIANIIIDEQDQKKLETLFRHDKHSNGLSCKHCGAALKETDQFCPVCGKQLPKKCPNCHAENDENAKFCSACGTKLEEEK